MKKMKRLVALALSVVMVLAMSVVAFAATGDDAPESTTAAGNATTGSTTYTITAPATSHQYEIYQIFTGDLRGETLSNVKWGANAKNENASVTVGAEVPETVINALTAVNSSSDTEKLAVIKKYADLNSTPVKTISNGATYTAKAGYYLIKDKDGTVTGDDTYTLYIVKVAGDVTIAPKSEKPSFEKKIKDTNDTTGVTSDWQDSADYDIGDKIPFQLKGTVAADYAKYAKYYFAFHDKEERGLSFDSTSVEVYVDGNKITSGYEVKTSGMKHTDCTFEVVFANLKEITGVHAGSVITVEYKSTLNENATIGKPGNVNSANLEYSNNPNQEQGETPSTGETPWDNVIVFTYKVVVNKVNQNNQPLAGAEFTLSKKLKDGTTKAIAVIKSSDGTKFEFSGLDDGDYVLTETKTPDGYNTIKPITFTVTAEHNIVWTSVNTRNEVLTSLSGNAASGEITFTPNPDMNELATNVVNNAGSQLPSTGGIGTTIFYIVGGILMVGAAVLLITKRRAEN